MSGSVEIPWVQLLTLLVHGPDPEPTIRGAISCWDGEELRAVGWTRFDGEPEPVFAGSGLAPGDDGSTSMRVWRDGSRVRLSRPDGRPRLIVGAEFCWEFPE